MPVLAPATIGVEILDSPAADPVLVRRMLGDIVRANRWFGGVAAMEAGLRVLLPSTTPPRQVTLLDVGTGAGDLPLAARDWGRKRGVDIRGVGVERHRAAAQLSRENGVPCVVACGSALPFRTPMHHSPFTDSVDLVLISQLLHHFDDDAAVALIAAAAAVARHGVILADLRPAFGAATAFRLAGCVLGFHRSTVADGVVSMARGRDAAALATLAQRAGAIGLVARELPMARVMVAFRTSR